MKKIIKKKTLQRKNFQLKKKKKNIGVEKKLEIIFFHTCIKKMQGKIYCENLKNTNKAQQGGIDKQ